MSVQAKALINAQFALNVLSTLYTSPQNTYTIIDKFTLTNPSGSTATITVYIVPSGGTAGTSNLIIFSYSLASHNTADMTVLQNQVLNPGDTIQVAASALSSIVVRGSGRQVT